MSDKGMRATNLSPGVVLSDYVDSESYNNISGRVCNLRDPEATKMTNLEARRAVEDVFEMQRYREMHQDYYDF